MSGEPPLSRVSLTIGAEPRQCSILLEHVSEPRGEAIRKKQCDLWAFVWASGVVASEVLWSAASDDGMRGLKMLELGCGSGIPSLLASHMCGACVTATDFVMDALGLLQRNSASLAWTQAGELVTRKLDWNAVVEDPTLLAAYDIVLGADVLYLSSCVRAVVTCAASMLKAGGILLLVDPGRPTTETLEDEAVTAGLTCLAAASFTNLVTPVATMAKCCVFVFQKGSEGETPSPVGVRVLSSLSRLEGMVSSGPPPKEALGYTLDASKAKTTSSV